MSFRLEREKTKTTPYILIDEDKSLIRFEGESYLEDIISFFKEINEWLEKYLTSDFEILTFDCALEYFNSSTAKLLFNILRAMDKSAAAGKKIIVNWIIAKNDEMLIECAEDFKEEMEHLEFNLIINNK